MQSATIMTMAATTRCDSWLTTQTTTFTTTITNNNDAEGTQKHKTRHPNPTCMHQGAKGHLRSQQPRKTVFRRPHTQFHCPKVCPGCRAISNPAPRRLSTTSRPPSQRNHPDARTSASSTSNTSTQRDRESDPDDRPQLPQGLNILWLPHDLPSLDSEK